MKDTMNQQASNETFAISGPINFTGLYSKYFTPLKLEIDYSKANPQTEEYLDFLRKKEEKSKYQRDVNLTFQMIMVYEEGKPRKPYFEYDFEEFSSQVLFKKPLSDLDEEQEAKLEEFYNHLLNISALHIEDYWKKIYSRQEESNHFVEAIDGINEIEEILTILRMKEDIKNSEMVLRHRDKFGNVIVKETTRVDDVYTEPIFDHYIQIKYQNFLHRYGLKKHITPDEIALNIPIIESLQPKEFDEPIAYSAFILEIKKIYPSCTIEYFEELKRVVNNNIEVKPKTSPLYEFTKIMLPKLNEFIEDHAHKGYVKKQKHLLLFSILRIFNFVPKKTQLSIVEGTIDAKEDYIKQIIYRR